MAAVDSDAFYQKTGSFLGWLRIFSRRTSYQLVLGVLGACTPVYAPELLGGCPKGTSRTQMNEWGIDKDNQVVEYVDLTLTLGKPSQIQTLKEQLGMGNLSHVDDVAGAREFCR
jgi:hypothetical protein